MAKQKQPALDQGQVSQLAEKLFVSHWPGARSQYDASYTVEKCFEAAEAFLKRASECRPVYRTAEAEPEPTNSGS